MLLPERFRQNCQATVVTCEYEGLSICDISCGVFEWIRVQIFDPFIPADLLDQCHPHL